MKNVIIIITVIVIIFPAGILQAQSGFEFRIGTGLSFPSGPEAFHDFWNTGFNISGAIIKPVSSAAAFMISLNYNHFSIDKKRLLGNSANGGDRTEIYGGSTAVRDVFLDLKLSTVREKYKTNPYLLFGVGIFGLNVDEVRVSNGGYYNEIPGDSELALGFSFGLGVDFPINPKLVLFVEGKYIMGLTDYEKTSLLPFKIGLTFK